MKFSATIQDRSFEIEVKKENDKVLVMVDNEPTELKYETDRRGLLSALIIDGKRYELRCDDRTGIYKVYLWQKPYEVSFSGIETNPSQLPEAELRRASSTHRIIKAPMSGLVIAIHTTQDKEVKQGDSLILLEAMKMQNEIRSPIAAKVLQIYPTVGKSVEKGDKLIELESLT
jgi:biotin carboxyl carrier protein